MTSRTLLSCRSRFKNSIRKYTSNTADVGKLQTSEVAGQVKERLWDRWAKYWKNLYIDYKDVALDVVQGCKERPVRAFTYFSLLGSAYYLSKHNPDESSYRVLLLESSNKLMLVGEPIRNPVSVGYIQSIEQCYNEGIIRRLSLGILSFIWLDNYEKECAHYKARCSYLKPQLLGFHHRIIDIGVMDRWWVLEEKMSDFDINEEEFNHPSDHPSDDIKIVTT